MKTKDLFELLPNDVKLEIDMQLYDEFNNDYCKIDEYMNEIYSIRDLTELKRLESIRKRELTFEAIVKILKSI